MARYERGNEFWDISREGTRITLVAGEIGTPGTTTFEEMASSKLAETRWNVLLNQQARAGFKLYKPPVEAPPPAPVLPAQPVVHDVRNPELERAIFEDPENAQLYEVYGDWLQGQGDPRGKLIALQVATRGKQPGDKYHAAVDRFVNLHHEYLLGSIPPRIGWLHLGVVRRIEITGVALVAPVLAEALALPSSRFVTAIQLNRGTIFERDRGETAEDLANAIEKVALDAPSTLRQLSLGGETQLHDLGPLLPRLPELREFSLASRGEQNLWVDAAVIAQVVRSPWPKLESLALDAIRGDFRVDSLRPLFHRTDLAKLRELHFRTSFDGELASELLRSPIAAQLESLSFGYCDQFGLDDDIEPLLAGLHAFPRLRTLQLPRSRMSKERNAALGGLAIEVSDCDEARYESGWE
jgi:uncharacterized protein (TIGR02996 family)